MLPWSYAPIAQSNLSEMTEKTKLYLCLNQHIHRTWPRWLFPLPKTEDTNERKAFLYDWGDKRKIDIEKRVSHVFRGLEKTLVFIHTYIHNWSLQPISQDYWPSFSETVNFIHKWRDLKFKIDSERQIFF